MTNFFPRLLGAALFAVPLSFANTATTLAEDITFDIANETSATLENLYVYPSSLTSHNDLLGGDVLYPGEYGSVDIFDDHATCLYTVEGFFNDDTVSIEENVDICDLDGEEYVFVD